MIRTEDVIGFFDGMAPGWDAGLKRNETAIARILNNARINEGVSVLDVATGTGVLIPDYLSRKVSSVTAIDISPEMVKVAIGKFAGKGVTFLCGDASKTDFGRLFDRIVIFNAFPHFADQEGFIEKMSSLLTSGGYLTVCHDIGKVKLDEHHKTVADTVSSQLMEADDLAAIFAKYLEVTCVVSEDDMYQVVGRKR